MEPNGARLTPPGDRRVYRVGRSLFRVWTQRPDASAELYKEGEWVWTPIPSGSIMGHPKAEGLSSEDAGKLSLPD